MTNIKNINDRLKEVDVKVVVHLETIITTTCPINKEKIDFFINTDGNRIAYVCSYSGATYCRECKENGWYLNPIKE